MSSKETKSLIYYYVRRQWHDQLVKLCDNIIQSKGKDPLTMFWKAYGLGMSGNINDSLRTLESFRSRRDLQYPVSLALIYFHNKATNIDHEAIDQINAELSVAEDVTKEAGMILAARFSLYTNNIELASHILSKNILNKNSNFSSATPIELEAMCIDYWIALDEACNVESYSNTDALQKLAQLDGMIKGKVEQIDADTLMVWAISKLVVKQVGEALNVYSQIIAANPKFLPALIDKALLLASAGEWEQALDTAQRVLDEGDRDSLDALMIIAVHAFTQESQVADAVSKLEDYDKALLNREPSSIHSALLASKLFSGICSRNTKTLQICVNMCQRALRHCQDNITSAIVLVQLGKLHVMQGSGQYNNAMKMFREASKNDANNIAALEGMILCQLREGLNDDAEGQIELITVMHNDDVSAQFYYLQAIHARQGLKNTEKHVQHIDLCRDTLVQTTKNQALLTKACINPFNELTIMNPDFLMLIALEYLEHIDDSTPLLTLSSKQSNVESYESNNDSDKNEITPIVKQGISMLEKLVRIYPGIACTYIELSRSYLSIKKDSDALRMLHQIMSLQPHFAAGLVAIAKVELYKQNISTANRSLEQALSCDFSIRNNSLFRLVQAAIKAAQSKMDEAMNEMESIMKLDDIRSLSNSNDGSHTDSLRLTNDDRVNAFVLYAALLSRSRRLKEAKQVLAEAKVVFAGTAQEVQVLVATSQLAVERNDFDTAIRVLDKISDDSPTFHRAQILKSDILLNNNRDKEGFTQCYRNLVDRDPTAKNYALLGEAYLRILNPEAAIVALEQAYKLESSNTRLRGRIGRTLVATHEYHRAVDFYEEAIKESSKNTKNSSETALLAHDLAKLYVKLGRGDSAARVLERVLRDEHQDLTDYRQDVTALMLLGDVYKLYANEKVVETYEKARVLQKEVVTQVRSGILQTESSLIESEKSLLSEICEKIGSIYSAQVLSNLNSNQLAINQPEKYFLEAVQQNPMNVKAMKGLAKLYKARNDTENAKIQCQKIIHADPSDEEATTMYSEILFYSKNPDDAVQPLQDLLKSYPNNYRALDKLISLLRRSGKLDEAVAYITAAEENDRRSGAHPGLHYCKGLYARYTNDIGKAIVEFNLARKDVDYGPDALVNMVELYLNPNQDGAWEEKDAGPLDEQGSVNVAAAGTLLKELQGKVRDPLRFKILENYWLLASRSKSNIDNAMQSFISILDKDQDYLPAVLGMATGFMVEKNQHKAHNLLKRVAKMEQHLHDGDDYCRANLLLAKIYVDKVLYDQAQDLCKRCLAQNKSSSQAWEIMGLILEKEGNYDQASECYEKAWNLEFQQSPPVGFKLAFSYLKSKKYVEGIDICEKVLSQFPDYPKIKDEILKKCQMSLRSNA